MRRISLVLLLVLLSMEVPVSARLGETKEQLIARYGQPVKPIKPLTDKGRVIAHVMYFRFNNMNIDATLFEGVCHGEDFHFANEQQRIANLPAILEANSNGKQWILDQPTIWNREDRQAAAVLANDGLMLGMWTSRMRDFVYRALSSAQGSTQGF